MKKKIGNLANFAKCLRTLNPKFYFDMLLISLAITLKWTKYFSFLKVFGYGARGNVYFDFFFLSENENKLFLIGSIVPVFKNCKTYFITPLYYRE